MKEYYSLTGFGLFPYSAVCVKIVFFSPEMIKNILAVMRLFALILAAKNFLLNN